jgi:hypothetical protein
MRNLGKFAAASSHYQKERSHEVSSLMKMVDGAFF